LIVEFAKYRRESGHDAETATLEACELRLRPIIMTSCAFILGVVPLVFAQGAGAEMRRALGIAVFYGMLGVTVFGILLTPVFFLVMDRVSHSRHHLWDTARWVAKWNSVKQASLPLWDWLRRWWRTPKAKPLPTATLVETPRRSAKEHPRKPHAPALRAPVKQEPSDEPPFMNV
jgi:multidrug efflux pump